MSKVTILIAVTQLTGGTKVDGKVVPFTLPAGEELTSAAIKSLGIDKTTVAALKDAGKVAETLARTASSDDGPSASESAAIERAEKAEASVVTLTAELTEAIAARDDLAVKLEAARKLLTADQLKKLDEPAKA